MKTVLRTVTLIVTLLAAIALHPHQALADMRDAIMEACASHQCLVTNLQREAIPGTDIAHYNWDLRVGSGQYEMIGMDRVVRELAPWRPRPTAQSIMLVHGDTLTFKVAFLMGPVDASAASSISGFLAANNVDVWGITRRWAKVPLLSPEADLSFMAGWDLETDARDARTAMYVARTVRGFTGSGFGKMKYLGWSRGGQLGYLLAQQESQMPSFLRSMNGMVIVDVPYKTDDLPFKATACGVAAQIEAARSKGIYVDASGVFIRQAGDLAAMAPTDQSPFFPPGVTNIDAALIVGSATHTLLPYIPWYHLVGGEFNEVGLPVGLTFTNLEVFIEVMRNVPPYEANGVMLQGAQVVCHDDTDLDDHLDDVTIPTLYIGAQGGFGDLGFYTTSLLGSSYVDAYTIEVTGYRLTDYGHDDVFRARDAEQQVFEPVLDLIQNH